MAIATAFVLRRGRMRPNFAVLADNGSALVTERKTKGRKMEFRIVPLNALREDLGSL